MSKLINKRAAEVYRRARSIVVENELDATPRIRYNLEEAVIEADGKQHGFGYQGDFLVDDLVDPNESFVLVHPQTGEPIGASTTTGALQVQLTSHYYYMEEKSAVKAFDDAVSMAEQKAAYQRQWADTYKAAALAAESEKAVILSSMPDADTTELDERIAVAAQQRSEALAAVAEAEASKAKAQGDKAAFVRTALNRFE